MGVFWLLRFLCVGMIPSIILCDVSGTSSFWNFAFQRNAIQSSEDYGGIASRAVDGNRDNVYDGQSCTHTGEEFEPWWKVDLAVEYTIHTIVVTNRADHAQRLRGAVIRVGNSDVIANNEQCGETITADEISSNEKIEVECCLEGRFVSVQLENITGILTLCEVEVLGKASTTVESTINKATTQESSFTTVDIIATEFPSSEATIEEAPSPTQGRSPIKDEMCTTRVGKQIFSINSESSLISVGRAGFRSNSSNRLLTCSDGIWSTGFPRYINVNECEEDKNICSPQLTNQECIDNIGSYRCVCQQGFLSLGSKLCVPLIPIGKQCKIGGRFTY
ncbi:uncharacterized protein [Ptychodera flava]|uniref:uncharacterized protein n=1 Tax=Ptychodera flava TaxID=63121 RepID=UPI00396AAACE